MNGTTGGFFRELQRRKVFKTVALYVVAAWVLLQVADLAFPGFGIPEEAIRYVWIGAVFGLPLVVLFAWRYQVTLQGIVRSTPLGPGEVATLPLLKRDYLILGALLLAATGVGYRAIVEIREVPTAIRLTLGDEILPNSIAVLPLRNVTGDPDQEYFVAGMLDALITDLSKISALKVISRSSASVYRNVVQSVRQTGLELGVAHIIEGSVFRTEDRVRINIQLIDTATDENLWSENYESDIEDVLTLQGELAREIAEKVRVELTPEEESRLTSTRKVNPETYETYLRGMFLLNQYTPDGMQRGLAYLDEAVENDPDDPLAYAGLALGYTLIGHSENPPPGVWAKAREAAVRALELDPSFPEAVGALAEIQLYYDWDWSGAEQSFRRALQLNANLDFTHAHYAWYLQLTGDAEAAFEHMRRAQQIAPVTPIFAAWLGWLHWGENHLDEAIAEAQKSLELNPSFPWGLYVLGGAYAAKGMYEEAIATHERLFEIVPTLGRWGLGSTYAQMGREQDARRVLAELAENPGQKDLVFLGIIYAALGDEEEALRWLETAYQAHVDWFPWVGARTGTVAFAGLASLRDTPRFRNLVAELGLPDG
ncbi:MAG: tetratricopeptide repeat protein [Gemmatimonadota bacterium]